MSYDEMPYDEMIDRLAAWTVESVTCPGVAVRVYWLGLVIRELAEPLASSLTVAQLWQQSIAHAPLPEWARPYAMSSLTQLLRERVWLEAEPVMSLQPQAGVSPGDAWATWESADVKLASDYRPYVDELQDETSRLWQAACWLYGEQPVAWQVIPLEVLRGAVLFEAGLFFACHEYFETLWGRTDDVASDFYQGLIQVAVAMRHLESHNRRGAQVLLGSGLARLRRYPDAYKGLPVDRFVAQLERLGQSLDASAEVSEWGDRPGLLVGA